MRDKKWFIKELIRHEIGDYGNYYNSGYEDALAYTLVLAHQLDEPEKVVIPQFVAEYLCRAKADVTLMRVLELANTRNELPKWEKEYDWISANDETFARAWLYGFTVEEEQKFYVLDKEDATLLKKSAAGEGVAKSVGTNIYNVKSWKDEEKYQLTEQEIRDYDERYWAFAVEVAE